MCIITLCGEVANLVFKYIVTYKSIIWSAGYAISIVVNVYIATYRILLNRQSGRIQVSIASEHRRAENQWSPQSETGSVTSPMKPGVH